MLRHISFLRKRKNQVIIAAVVLTGGGTLVGFYETHRSSAPIPSHAVSSFASCEKSPGSAVLETTPEVCVSKDGSRFSETPTALVANTYPLSKTKYIEGFDKAPDSLRQALVGTFFDEAQASCLANDKVNKDAPDDMVYLDVMKVVQGKFAQVAFCAEPSNSILVDTSDGWKKVAHASPLPSCSLVDSYKISRQIEPLCTVDGTTTTRQVSYE